MDRNVGRLATPVIDVTLWPVNGLRAPPRASTRELMLVVHDIDEQDMRLVLSSRGVLGWARDGWLRVCR